MIVYRLEDREHKGAFYSNKSWPKRGRRLEDKALHNRYGCTLPFDVKYGPRSKDYRFGTDSLKKLEDYFGNRLKYFLEEGWVIGVYKVRRNYVRFSPMGIEVAFLVDKSKRL